MYILYGIICAAAYLLYDYLECKDDTYVINNMKAVIVVAIGVLGPMIILAIVILAVTCCVGWLVVKLIGLLENVEIHIKR